MEVGGGHAYVPSPCGGSVFDACHTGIVDTRVVKAGSKKAMRPYDRVPINQPSTFSDLYDIMVLCRRNIVLYHTLLCCTMQHKKFRQAALEQTRTHIRFDRTIHTGV